MSMDKIVKPKARGLTILGEMKREERIHNNKMSIPQIAMAITRIELAFENCNEYVRMGLARKWLQYTKLLKRRISEK